MRRTAALLARGADIKMALFDVDGVLTDGRIILGPDGGEYKCFDVRDGQGIAMLRAAGIEVGIITGRQSQVVAERMSELGIEEVHQGVRDKSAKLADILKRNELKAQQVCYVGDDLPDLSVMLSVGLPLTVRDADPRVLEVAAAVTDAGGGRGAVREVCELILEANGLLADIVAAYR
ncbi:MAG: HAD-IIIA family hydrolase [Pseudomonadota bacterium]